MASADEYLNRHSILTYLEDAVSQLLVYKDSVNKVDVRRFFFEYFKCVQEGNHTAMREYAFIKSTSYNRACFILLFYKCFATLGRKDLLTIREYHNLMSILCRDFPYDHMQKTAKIVLTDDAHDCLISFSDFLYAFQLQFYYQEFLDASYEIYQSLHDAPPTNKDIIVPTDQTTNIVTKSEPVSANTEGVESSKFCRALSQLADKCKSAYSFPSLTTLKEILSETRHVTFYNFLAAMSKSEAINLAIGKLPAAENLFDGIDSTLPVEHALPAEPAPEPVIPPPQESGRRSTVPVPTRVVARRQRNLRSRRKTASSDSSTSESSDSDD